MSIQLEDVQKFFFYAMMQGYAGYTPKQHPASLPGHNEVDIISGSWRCLDRWCVTPLSNKSAGTTTIWYENDPVWVMNYGGQYTEEVIDFLKLALRENYERQFFLGCRGPASFTQPGKELLYTNSLFQGSKTFAGFNGWESIKDYSTNQLLGYHGYMGMSLLP